MDRILGKKIGMTHIFTESGDMVPVTVIKADPGTVLVQRKAEKAGYNALQVGFNDCKEKHISKAVAGHFKKVGVSPKRSIIEIKTNEQEQPEVGSKISLSIFEGIKKVSVAGTSKGRGFAGTVKRHGFTRGPETHGSRNVREPGSVGAGTYPGRTFPGLRLPGQYGNKQVTVKGLKIVKLDLEKNLMFVKGAVPGPINGAVIVKKA